MAIEQYDNLPEDHNLVEHYQPKFLAKGGDRLVYEVPDHPDVVVKASTYTVKDVLSENRESGQPLDTLSQGAKERLTEEVSAKNEHIRQLRRHFGVAHTVAERMYLMKVPVTNEIVEEIFKDDFYKRTLPILPEGLNEAWSVVAVQNKVKEVKDSAHLSLNFGDMVEREVEDSEAYLKLNELFLTGESISQEDISMFLKTQDKSKAHSFTSALLLSEKEPGLLEALRDFVSKSISFTKETGNTLALAGLDNVIFSKKDGEWNYILVDALTVHKEPVFEESLDIIKRGVAGEEISPDEKDLLMKALNYTRVMNGLAFALGLPERLDLVVGNHGSGFSFINSVYNKK